jgi:hypothetical protein
VPLPNLLSHKNIRRKFAAKIRCLFAFCPSHLRLLQLHSADCVAMLDVFPTWSSHMAERRTRIGTRRKTEGEPVARLARTRLLRRAPVRARSRVTANHPSNRRHIAENRLLLSPVMILPTSWFVWRFRSITGEIFFARNVLPRAGRFAGPNAGRSAGPESPVPRSQVVEFAQDFGTKIFRENPAEVNFRDVPRWRL